jgi:hypothetical protein
MTVRTRVIAVATALGLLFVLGVAWLVHRATSTPETQSAGFPAEATGPSTSPATTDPTVTDPAVTATSATTPGTVVTVDPAPPKPRRSIRVTGVRLDGDQVGDRCGLVFLTDRPGITIRIAKISPTVDPASPSGHVTLDDDACQDQSPPNCRGASLGPGGSDTCVIGVGSAASLATTLSTCAWTCWPRARPRIPYPAINCSRPCRRRTIPSTPSGRTSPPISR